MRQIVARLFTMALLAGPFSVSAQVLETPETGGTIIVGGDCTLADAITSANNDRSAGGCELASGTYGGSAYADVIELPENATILVSTRFSENYSYSGSVGLPGITSKIIINGHGSTIARNSSFDFRIFTVAPFGELTLNKLTVTNGSDTSYNGGGAIFSNAQSTLTLKQCTFSGNASSSGGGGAISSGGALTVEDSTFFGNSSTGSGGAILSGNFGAISNSTFFGNSANTGGAISIFNFATIGNSTVTANSASDSFGGLVVKNDANVTLSNSIFVANTAPEVREIGALPSQYGGTPGIISSSNSVYGHAGETSQEAFTNFSPSDTDKNATQGNLAAALNAIVLMDTSVTPNVPLLANNGGPTKTVALVGGSIAINASGDGATVADQRGIAALGVRDIGAFEFVPPPTVTGIDPASGPATGGTQVTITGTKFVDGGSKVKFGTSDATSFTVTSPTNIIAISPAGTGTVHVTVTTADGTSVTGTADQFSYQGDADGVCASPAATASAPTNLCVSGVSGMVSSTGGQWAWACNATGAKTVNASCSAPFAIPMITLSKGEVTEIVAGGSATVTASSTSGDLPALSSKSGSVCTVSPVAGQKNVSTGSVTGVVPGTCTIEASLVKTADNCTSCYQAASETVDISVVKISQTLDDIVAEQTSLNFGSSTTISTTASSELPVSYSSLTPEVCSVAVPMISNYVVIESSNGSSATVTPIYAGKCTVAADQGGSDLYAAAPRKTLDITINPVAPSAPTNLQATGLNGGVSISFTAGNSGGDRITNYEYSISGNDFVAFVPSITSSPVQISGLNNDVRYRIRIRAVTKDLQGVASDTVLATPTAAITGAPTSLSGRAGDGQVKISFAAPSGDISNYEYSLDGGDTFTPMSPATTTSPLVIKDLKNGTTYNIAIRAANGATKGSSSSVITLTPLSDFDTDGVADLIETQVPDATGFGKGDGNGDGVEDNTQDNVASLPDAEGNFITLASAANVPLKDVQIVETPDDFPTDAGAVFAGVSFVATNASGTKFFELYVPKSMGTVTGLRKKNLVTHQWDTIPSAISEAGNSIKIVYSLADNGPYDADPTIGTISDPVFVVGSTSKSKRGGGAFGLLTLLPLAGISLLRRRKKLH